jgi:hypothetical protein
MPFDHSSFDKSPFDRPRLFSAEGQRCDDASSRPMGAAVDEELGLSAELQVLASHLRGEADSLAERYAPSTSPQPQSVHERRSMRRWMWQSMAVGMAGLALLAWRIERWQQSPPAAPVPVAVQSETHAIVQSTPPVAVLPANVASSSVAPSSAARASVASTDPAVLRHSQGIAEVGIDAPAVERHPPADQVEMLRIQVSGFEKVIRKLQAELIARDAAQIEAQQQIELLQAEVAALRAAAKERAAK